MSEDNLTIWDFKVDKVYEDLTEDEGKGTFYKIERWSNNLLTTGDGYSVWSLDLSGIDWLAKRRFKEVKEKKRYWRWKINDAVDGWYRDDVYMDNKGMNTKGKKETDLDNLEKIKCKDDFIDV